ncbi:MAG: hypothetical protein A3G70_02530 [Planctomycetes bacterium RIFCSPLOWO2_12_FULL_39_13]|nr:MAG: hypothetical protein A2Y11_05895 [Planctomycetes bacterium GWC2_39_26]OHB99262.1 MAG: hypothetical protein A3G70_02530 [Planctomycetes bacterium RIFCSPLOWO2_12_FULL_39_13]
MVFKILGKKAELLPFMQGNLKRLIIPFIFIILSSSTLFAQSENTSNTITGLTESSGFTYNNFVSGNFRTQYEGRWAEDEDDYDMYEYLRFKTKNFFDNKVSIAGSGRLSEDLDGHEPKDGAFRDILDTYDSSVNGRLYYLYADIKNPVIDKSSLRVGRQYQYSVETILFDGAKYEQQLGPIDTYAFGGMRTSQYSETYFDTVAGSGIAIRPFMDTRTNLDYVRIIDDNYIDEEVGFNLWQRIYDDLNFYGRYTILNTLPKDFLVKLSWDKIDWDASVQLSYFRFLNSIAEQSNNISPFYQILGTFEPFDLISLTGYKGFGEKFGISSGMDYRNVLDKGNENTFNTDYNRAYFSFLVNNVLLKESKASFTVEYWNADGMDQSTDIGVDYDKKIGKFDIGLGTNYSLYKYNFDGSNGLESVLDSEYTRDIEQKINVRTYYLRIKYLLTKQSDVSMRWSTEISDTDPETYNQLLLSYSTNF